MGKNDTITKQDNHKIFLISEFRRKVQDILEPHHDDQYLEKWLIARDYDLTKAEKMIRENFVYRKKMDINTLLTDFQLPEVVLQNKVTELLGFDKENSAVRVFMIGICDYKGFIQSTTPVELMRVILYFLESDIKKMEDKKKAGEVTDVKTTFVLDYTDFSFRKFYNKQVVKLTIQLLSMFQDNYPEALKSAYLVNVPSYFTFLFNIFKPILSASTLNRIKVYNTVEYQEELRNLLDSKLIPAFLGGDLTGPDGDPKCSHMIDWNTKIDSRFFLQSNIETDDPSMKTVTVQQRGVLKVPVEVTTTDVVLKWVFMSKEYNIRFGLFFRTGDKSSKLEEVIPMESVDCHIVKEENEFICRKTGTYILHFDNSYSWLTAKQISYKVELEKLDTNDVMN